MIISPTHKFLVDIVYEAAMVGVLDVFECWREMAVRRACAIAAGRDPADVQFALNVILGERFTGGS